jgi:hypothetical protein
LSGYAGITGSLLAVAILAGTKVVVWTSELPD